MVPIKISKALIFFFSRDTSGSAIHTEKQVAIDAPIYEQYIDLLCQFKPQDVYNFIMVNEGYRLEQTLEVCLFLNARGMLIFKHLYADFQTKYHGF